MAPQYTLLNMEGKRRLPVAVPRKFPNQLKTRRNQNPLGFVNRVVMVSDKQTPGINVLSVRKFCRV